MIVRFYKDQMKRLKREAKFQKVSMAEVVRQLVSAITDYEND